MRATESREDYLETILILSQERLYVRSVDVAERLGVTKPSVSRAISLLRTAGMINMDPHDGALTLTEEGRAVAEHVYGRHRLLTKVLTMLGVDEKTAAVDACKAEHILSEVTLEKIRERALLTDAENSCKDADKTDN